MKLYLPLVLTGSLCAIAAHAQTPDLEQKPTSPLQATPDASNKRGFAIGLNHVPASLMAYWLDPKHNEVPPFARETTLVRPPVAFVLPAGVERLSALPDQKVITFYATRETGDKLAKIVAQLDRPLTVPGVPSPPPITPSLTAPSLNIPLVPSVECVCTVYWIDSLAPTAQTWANKANSLSIIDATELDALTELAGQDRALLKSLPSVLIGDSVTQKAVPFAPAIPGWSPFGSPERRYSMPTIPFGPQIDPGIEPNIQRIPKPKRGELVLSLAPREEGLIGLSVTTPSINGRATGGTITVRPGKTLVLSGSARKSGLKPPSPRFDAFVLCITPHIVTPTVQAVVPRAQ